MSPLIACQSPGCKTQLAIDEFDGNEVLCRECYRALNGHLKPLNKPAEISARGKGWVGARSSSSSLRPRSTRPA